MLLSHESTISSFVRAQRSTKLCVLCEESPTFRMFSVAVFLSSATTIQISCVGQKGKVKAMKDIRKKRTQHAHRLPKDSEAGPKWEVFQEADKFLREAEGNSWNDRNILNCSIDSQNLMRMMDVVVYSAPPPKKENSHDGRSNGGMHCWYLLIVL